MSDNQTNTSLVRGALIANALFSSVCTISLLLYSSHIAKALFSTETTWFNLSIDFLLFLLGIGLAIFVLSLLYTAFQKVVSIPDVLAIIFGDLSWVLISGIILFLGQEHITNTGQLVIITISGVIFSLGILQWIGIKRIQAY